MLVELVAACGHIAAACPGIDRIFEHAHRGAKLVECRVAPYQVTAVREPPRKAPRAREQQQPRRLDRTAVKEIDVCLLLNAIAADHLVHRPLARITLVDG